MAIHMQVARAARELEAVYQLRARARQELGPAGQAAEGPQVDRFDTFTSTTNILIRDGETAIGTMRVAEESDPGLPADAFNNFAPIRGFLSGKLIGIDQVALLRAYRQRPGILIAAMKVVVQVVRARQGRHLLMVAPQEVVPYLEEAGLSTIGPAEWSEAARCYLVPLYGLLSALRLPFVEFSREATIETLGHWFNRSIYSEGEEICREGEDGDCAFVVARGSVGVTTSGPDGTEVLLSILGPGDVFGELALLDAGPRVGTVRAYAPETDLVVMERAVFRETVLGDPVRTEALLRLLARRLRDSSSRLAAIMPADCTLSLLQLLVDAARSRHLSGDGLLEGVTPAWIAGQVGRPPTLIRELLGALERDGILTLRDDGVFLRDLARLQRCLEDYESDRSHPIDGDAGRPVLRIRREGGHAVLWRSGLERLS
jgi:CRP-like cAMP-binding protein